jgi:hypothetical protein
MVAVRCCLIHRRRQVCYRLPIFCFSLPNWTRLVLAELGRLGPHAPRLKPLKEHDGLGPRAYG